MNSKIIVAALLGALATFILGFICYGLLLMDYMSSNMIPGAMKTEAEMGASSYIFLFLGTFASSLLLAYVFDRWANIRTAGGGAKAGALLGLLMILSFDFGMYATTNLLKMNFMLLDIALNVVFAAAAGAIIGWWLGRNPA